MDCKKMWIIRTLLMLLAFSAHTYAFYIKTDDVELQQEPSEINLENTNDYNNYAPEPRSLGLMETYEKLRNYLTSPWKKESNSSILTPENMQNVSQYENMQQNELSFDPYHLTKQNISRSDPVDFHASEILPILTEKYLKINLTAGQKKSEENFEDVKDDLRMDDSRFQLKNDAINDIFSNASESENVIATKQEDDEDEPTDLLRSLNPSDYAEDLVEGQDNKNLTEKAENIVDTGTNKDNIIEITNEESNNDIAGDINQKTTEKAVELVENMIEDSEDQFSTIRAQVISTTMIPSDETTSYIILDFVQSNINNEENHMNSDQVENFKRETKKKSKMSGDDDDFIVIESIEIPAEITESPASFNDNDDSLIVQGRRLSSDEITTQLPEGEITTSTQLNEVDTIPNRNEDINILNYIINPSSDISTTTFPIVTNPVLEDRTNSDLDKNIFSSTPSTFEENTSEISHITETTPQIDQIETITENKFQLRMTFPGVIDDLILVVPRPLNATENKNNITEAPEPCNYNDDSLIIVGRSLNCVEGETMSTHVNGVDVVPEIETESNILNKINPSNDIFSVTNEHLESPSTTVFAFTSDRVLEDHTSSDLEENIFTTTISTIGDSNSKIIKYDEILHDQTSQNITELNEIAETTTQIDQTKNIRSDENDDSIVIVNDLENTKDIEDDSSIMYIHNSETTSQPELTTLKVESDTEDSSEYFANLLGKYTDFDTTINVNTTDIIQMEQFNETSTITAPVYNEEDLASPILTDPFNVFEISEELVKPRSIMDESVDKLENLDVNNIEETTLNTIDTDTSTQLHNEYMNNHHQSVELTTEFATDHQTVKQELFPINASTELNKDIHLTTEKYLEHLEKIEDISDQGQVIYTTTESDSTTIDIQDHNNYEPSILSNEQDQDKTVTDGVVNGRSFDFSVNLIEIPKVEPTTTQQHEKEDQFDLTTEKSKTIDTLIADNSDQFTQNFATAPPFSYIETGEPSVFEVEDKTYSPATEINFSSYEEDSMRISDHSSDLLKISENIFTTELPKREIVDTKYQNHEFNTASNEASNELEHEEDISESRKFSDSVFEEESVTEGKTDLENAMITVNQISSFSTTLSENLNTPQQLDLVTEDSKTLEMTTKDRFEHVTPISTEIQTFNPSSESVINESNESNQTGESSLEVKGVHFESTEDSDSKSVELNNISDDLTTKFVTIKNEDSKSDESNEHGEKSTGEDQQNDSVSNEDSSNDISPQSHDLDSKFIDRNTKSENSESDESNYHSEKPTDGEDQQNDSVSTEDSSMDISAQTRNLASKSTVRKNSCENSESDESNQLDDKTTDSGDQQKDSVSSESSSIDISAQSRDLASTSTDRKNNSENSESDESNQLDEKTTDSEDQQNDSVSNEDSSIDISAQSRDLASKSTDRKNSSENSESDESNQLDEKTTDSEDQQKDSVSNESSSIDISAQSRDLASKSTDRKNSSENSESDESNQLDEKTTDSEDQQNDSVSNEDSSIDISAQSRDLASKSTDRKNSSENSESDESNEYEEKPYKGDSNQSELSEENSSSIETIDQATDNKSDYSASGSIESEEKPSNEESFQSASIEDDSSSFETNNKNDSDNSESSESGENSSKSKTFDVEKRTDSASNEKDSSTAETDENSITPKAVTNKFDNEDNQLNDSNQAGERTSEEFHHIEKKFQSTSSEDDISSIENSDQSEEDHEDHSFKSKKTHDSEEDSSEESVEEIIPFPIQRVPQGRSFSFDENNNRHDYGQQITPDKKSPPFTKVVLSDPIEGEIDNQSVVMDKEIENDSNNKRGMEDEENSPDSDDVSTAVVETLIEAAELTTEFTRHISSFRSSTEASSTISDTTYETSTTSFPPDMDESDRGQLNYQVNSIAESVSMSKLTILILIGLAIFAIVATIAAVLIFKYHNRRETFDIQLEERHVKKDSNTTTTQSTTNGVE